MRLSLSVLLLAIIVTAASAIAWSPTGQSNHAIVDVSWPNCKVTLPNASSWGIVGVTGGLDFRSNPCLAQESSSFSQLALYMNTGYPGTAYAEKFKSFPDKCGSTNYICLAYNYGYNATLYALSYANKEGAHTSLWWLDVETDNSWTNNTILNRFSLEGAVAALKLSTFLPITVGFYSSQTQWNTITGGWQNNLPSWIGTGSKNPQLAIEACKDVSFSGGPIWIAQYTKKLDMNYVCGPKFRQSLGDL